MLNRLVLLLFIVFTPFVTSAQQKKARAPEQIDLLDVVAKVFHPSAKPREVAKKKVAFSVVPTT
ncbi:MAG: hypothetical protein ACK5R0_01410, partial [Bacteroidota bacterium]